MFGVALSLNLISDRWIPVRRSDGGPTVIRPDEIADPGVVFPDWPRADLNIACLELLIGLVFLADPPSDEDDWDDRRQPDAARLKARLAPFAPAFDLMGDGPRFLQDREPLEGDPNPPDMLFIDSAGGNTVRNNADLLVKRDRYPVLDPALAAMALYTLQAFAPSGGAGNRTSMRGGGPMVTLVDPGTGRLWDLVWANVPDGRPAGPQVLPWMGPTRRSEAKGSEVYPAMTHPAEAFFGMPRRLMLTGRGNGITGVVQRPYGTNYAGWEHPLTPHYRQKAGSELLPLHPRAGVFGYRNWLGIVMEAADDGGDTRRRAPAARAYERRVPTAERRGASLIVGGWSMDNAKPRDFTLSRQPLLPLESEAGRLLVGMIDAAEAFGVALRGALKPVAGEGSALDALREEFFIDTQAEFDTGVAALTRGVAPPKVAEGWRAAMERAALAIFDRAALPGLDGRRAEEIGAIVQARKALRDAFAGSTKLGREAFERLELAPRARKAKEKA